MNALAGELGGTIPLLIVFSARVLAASIGTSERRPLVVVGAQVLRGIAMFNLFVDVEHALRLVRLLLLDLLKDFLHARLLFVSRLRGAT